jgi:hypothetical protein
MIDVSLMVHIDGSGRGWSVVTLPACCLDLVRVYEGKQKGVKSKGEYCTVWKPDVGHLLHKLKRASGQLDMDTVAKVQAPEFTVSPEWRSAGYHHVLELQFWADHRRLQPLCLRHK